MEVQCNNMMALDMCSVYTYVCLYTYLCDVWWLVTCAVSSLCTNVLVQSMHIRDRSHAEWDHYTQLTLCSRCRYTVIQTMRSRSARRSPFTEWCWAEPFPCANMAISPTCVCVGNERVESQCSVLPQPEVTMALKLILKSL